MPFIWFLMSPPDESGELECLEHNFLDFYILLFGRDDQVESIIGRLHRVANRVPSSGDDLHNKLEELRTLPRERSYLERRMQVLLAGLEERVSALEGSARALRSFYDYLRQVGVQGFVNEQTTSAILDALPFYRGRFDAPKSEEEGHMSGESSSASSSDK